MDLPLDERPESGSVVGRLQRRLVKLVRAFHLMTSSRNRRPPQVESPMKVAGSCARPIPNTTQASCLGSLQFPSCVPLRAFCDLNGFEVMLDLLNLGRPEKEDG